MKVTQNEIYWNHVSEDYVAIATDRNGQTFLHRSVPYKDQELAIWLSDHPCRIANVFKSFKRGDVDWGDSLVIRPE